MRGFLYDIGSGEPLHQKTADRYKKQVFRYIQKVKGASKSLLEKGKKMHKEIAIIVDILASWIVNDMKEVEPRKEDGEV